MTDSWELKVQRAEHHLKEVKNEVHRFSDSHPYKAVPGVYSRRHANVRRYKLAFTDQPDEMLAVMIGDVVHNLRSALDHALVSIAPNNRRRKVGFPIFSDSPFDALGQLLDNEAGKSWDKLTRGIPEAPMAIVKALQPFQPPPDESVVEFCAKYGLRTSELSGLALLSKFDNADKHRELVTVASGLEKGEVTVRVRGQTLRHELLPYFYEESAELIRVNFQPKAPPESEVEVEVNGTARVAIEVRKDRGVTGLPGTLERLIPYIRAITRAITDRDQWPSSD